MFLLVFFTRYCFGVSPISAVYLEEPVGRCLIYFSSFRLCGFICVPLMCLSAGTRGAPLHVREIVCLGCWSESQMGVTVFKVDLHFALYISWGTLPGAEIFIGSNNLESNLSCNVKPNSAIPKDLLVLCCTFWIHSGYSELPDSFSGFLSPFHEIGECRL
jgi:hypothetical protein